MPNAERLLNEWSNPLFLASPRRSRDLYLFCLTAQSGAAPLGLIWYAGDKGIRALARKAGISLTTDTRPLVEVGLAKHDTSEGILYFPQSLSGGWIKNYSVRNISSWEKRVHLMPEVDLVSEWRSELMRCYMSYPKKIAEKVFEKFSDGTESQLDTNGNIGSADAVALVRYFATCFEKEGHGTYIGDWSREVRAAKDLLTAETLENLKARIDLYFKDDWLCSKTSMDFMSFRRNVNKFAKSAGSSIRGRDLSGYWEIVKRERDEY